MDNLFYVCVGDGKVSLQHNIPGRPWIEWTDDLDSFKHEVLSDPSDAHEQDDIRDYLPGMDKYFAVTTLDEARAIACNLGTTHPEFFI